MGVDLALLRKWRAAAEAELQTLREHMRPLEEDLARRQEELAALDRLLALHDPQLLKTATAARGGNQTTGGSAAHFLDVAVAALGEESQPLHYKELYCRVVRAGCQVPGHNAAANLLAQMGRDARFVRVARGTYGLAQWNLRAAPAQRRRKRRSRR